MAGGSDAGMQAAPAALPAPARIVARIVAPIVLVGGVGLSTFSLVVALSTYGKPGAYASNPLGEFGAFGFAVTLLALGFVLRSRRPANRIGPLFLTFGVFASLAALAWTSMLVGFLPTGDKRLGAVSSWLGATVSITTWTYLITALIIRFPHGEPATRGEARLLRWLPVVCLAAGITTAFRPGRVLVLPGFDNPVATPNELHPLLTVASNVALLVIVATTVAAGIAMFRRYRHTSDVERLQLRWFAFGAGIVVVASVVYLIAGVIVAPLNNGVRELTYALFVVSLTSLPIAVFQAIASHRLYDIDQIIGRTVAYGALTAVLAGIYAASVRLFNALFVSVTGEGSETALILTTLVLATTFTPIKGYLERLVARRFPPTVPTEAGSSPSPPILDGQVLTTAQLDARIEAVARRVAEETFAATGRSAPRRDRR